MPLGEHVFHAGDTGAVVHVGALWDGDWRRADAVRVEFVDSGGGGGAVVDGDVVSGGNLCRRDSEGGSRTSSGDNAGRHGCFGFDISVVCVSGYGIWLIDDLIGWSWT